MIKIHDPRIAALYEQFQDDPEYRTELCILDFTEQVVEWMDSQGVTRAELARRLGKSRAWVTRLLGGSQNLTIRTMEEVSMALGADLALRLHGRGSRFEGVAIFDTPHWETSHSRIPDNLTCTQDIGVDHAHGDPESIAA